MINSVGLGLKVHSPPPDLGRSPVIKALCCALLVSFAAGWFLLRLRSRR
jgi:hypothetical protein